MSGGPSGPGLRNVLRSLRHLLSAGLLITDFWGNCLKTYAHLTEGLQAVLLHWQRGYVQTTHDPVIVPTEKAAAIASKWVDAYGINLPAWKRHQRKQGALPNAVAIDLPVLRDPYKRQLVLMSTKPPGALHQDCPFLRERWTDKIRVQDFVLGENTHDRKTVTTFKLAPDVIKPLVKYWTDLSRRGEWSKSCADMDKAVALYPAFSGIRQQLRREIGGLKKLHAKARPGIEWPGPDPENLPIISGFRANEGAKN